MVAKKSNKKAASGKLNSGKWSIAVLIVLLIVSCTANLIQGINLTAAVQERRDNDIALNNYRKLQERQISFVKSNCESGLKKYGNDGMLDPDFNGMMGLAQYAIASGIVFINMDPNELFKDLLFEYLTTTCYRPRLLLLGVEDITDLNLWLYSQTTDFAFDESELDDVRW